MVPSSLYINGEEVERVGSSKFLGTYISEDLSWTINANMLMKMAQKQSVLLTEEAVFPENAPQVKFIGKLNYYYYYYIPVFQSDRPPF